MRDNVKMPVQPLRWSDNPEGDVLSPGLSQPSPKPMRSAQVAGVSASRPEHGEVFESVDWSDLVARVETGEDEALEELYRVFSRGIRFYLCRRLGPQDLDDKVHDAFLVVVQAIQRHELRNPERLMGFVRTIVRRQVALHIDRAVSCRRDQSPIDSGITLSDDRADPEEAAMIRQQEQIATGILRTISTRDREILTRFYLRQQTQEQICREMALSETQFRLLKSRAKARFGEIGRKKLSGKKFFVRGI